MRANYDPQKIWLQFIKVELYPSEKRGVKLKLSDHQKSQQGVIVGPLETPKHPSNKSFMEGNFTSGSDLRAVGFEPVPQLIIRFYDRRLIHSATEAEVSLGKNFSYLSNLGL